MQNLCKKSNHVRYLIIMQFCFLNLRKSLQMHVGREGGRSIQNFIFSVSILQICRTLNSIFSRHTAKKFVLSTQRLQEKHDSKKWNWSGWFFQFEETHENSCWKEYVWVIFVRHLSHIRQSASRGLDWVSKNMFVWYKKDISESVRFM